MKTLIKSQNDIWLLGALPLAIENSLNASKKK